MKWLESTHRAFVAALVVWSLLARLIRMLIHATQKGQELWRVKPWADAEILVTGVSEGEINTNEAKKNALGRTERSSARIWSTTCASPLHR